MTLSIDQKEIISNITLSLPEIVKAGAPISLSGGLRCITSSQFLSFEIVIKQGSYKEIFAQNQYLEALPPKLRALFPKVLFVAADPKEIDLGVMVLEKIHGVSLHSLLCSPYHEKDFKRGAVQELFSKLELMHSHSGGTTVRSVSEIILSIRKRMSKLETHIDLISSIETLLVKLEKKLTDEVITSCVIHGDAQCGNFIVSNPLDIPKIGFIDPLGGSGKSPGDYLYDWSRLYHWIDVAGLCYEIQFQEGLTLQRRQNALMSIREELVQQIWSMVKEKCRLRRDLMGPTWFFTYAVFHTSGKLQNFGNDTCTRMLGVKIQDYLRKAVE